MFLADSKPLKQSPSRSDIPSRSDVPNDASTRQTLIFDDNRMAAELYGEGERTLRILEEELRIDVRARGNEVRLIGDPVQVAAGRKVLEELYGWLRAGHPFHARDVASAARLASGRPDVELQDVYEDVLGEAGARRRVVAKNLSQRRYVELIRDHDMVFALGPAGTGKTYLAMACAIAALNRREVSRVILARPAVEAGERLGFLPGTLAEKVNPYLRPLYDALHDMMPFDKAERLVERGVIEVAPLAFMRGRTLNDSFVILDEAQNTTSEQMKMFLTRLGFDSKAVVTGDTTQIDLPPEKTSGLVEASHVLAGVDGIGFMRFTEADVVRHPLVQSIIRAYERAATTPSKEQ
jgi:phosphate starvation-inducible PhoH-like protein